MQFSLIQPIDRTPSSTTIPDQIEPESNGNEDVLRITEISRFTGTLPSDCLVSYPGHSLVEVLPLCRGAVGVLYYPCPLSNPTINV